MIAGLIRLLQIAFALRSDSFEFNTEGALNTANAEPMATRNPGNPLHDDPTVCSGPPHLLGPWGSAGLGAMRVASS